MQNIDKPTARIVPTDLVVPVAGGGTIRLFSLIVVVDDDASISKPAPYSTCLSKLELFEEFMRNLGRPVTIIRVMH